MCTRGLFSISPTMDMQTLPLGSCTRVVLLVWEVEERHQAGCFGIRTCGKRLCMD